MDATDKILFLTEMEKKLAGFEETDAMDEKGLLEDIDKMLSTALDWMNEGKGKVDVKELKTNMLKMQKIIREKDFTEKVDKAIREAEKMRKRKEEEQDVSLSSAWLMIHLFRSCYSSLCFLCGVGKYKDLYTLLYWGNEVLDDYYDWKKEGLSYIQSMQSASFLEDVLESLNIGKALAIGYGWCRARRELAASDTVKEVFKYVDKAYGERLDIEAPATPVERADWGRFSDEVYDDRTGMFCFPLGFKGWVGKKDDRYVVAFSGTQLSDAGMLYADVEQIVGPSLIYACAVGLVAWFAQREMEVWVCGHSLGGGLTQFAVTALNNARVQGWGFNSAGLSAYAIGTLRSRLQSAPLLGRIEHYVTGNDVVSVAGALLGNSYVLPGSGRLGHSRNDLRRAMGME